jgi:hypothetical protein
LISDAAPGATTGATTERSPSVRSSRLTEATLVTWILVAFLIWVPLQTPVAVLAWQYLHVSLTIARGILLTKDVWDAALFLFLLVRHRREIRFLWFDWFALAYAVLVVVYSCGPALLGSHLPALAVIASAREMLVPVELYGLGRLAGYAGVSVVGIVKAFLVVAAASAVFAVGAFILAPATFWQTTYNLVGFVHDVQGISSATSIWTTAILTMYGTLGYAVRAVGPFTHPVGTGVYFAMPFAMAVCAVWLGDLRHKAALAIAIGGLFLFALAILTPISRGTWIGMIGALVVGGALVHRYRLAGLTVVLFVACLVAIPPFSYGVWSGIKGEDSSTSNHASAIQNGVTQIISNPLSGTVGQNDQFSQEIAAASGVETNNVGENMYLTTYASVGPLGLLVYLIWLAALLVELFGRVRRSLPAWIPAGVAIGLLAETAAGMSASTLMRFTTAASMMLIVGLVLSAPGSALRRPDLAALRHPRRWLGSRRSDAEAAS